MAYIPTPSTWCFIKVKSKQVVDDLPGAEDSIQIHVIAHIIKCTQASVTTMMPLLNTSEDHWFSKQGDDTMNSYHAILSSIKI